MEVHPGVLIALLVVAVVLIGVGIARYNRKH